MFSAGTSKTDPASSSTASSAPAAPSFIAEPATFLRNPFRIFIVAASIPLRIISSSPFDAAPAPGSLVRGVSAPNALSVTVSIPPLRIELFLLSKSVISPFSYICFLSARSPPAPAIYVTSLHAGPAALVIAIYGIEDKPSYNVLFIPVSPLRPSSLSAVPYNFRLVVSSAAFLRVFFSEFHLSSSSLYF